MKTLAIQPVFCLTWSKTTKAGFLVTRLICIMKVNIVLLQLFQDKISHSDNDYSAVPLSVFHCNNTELINMLGHCDKHADCADSTDEMDCPDTTGNITFPDKRDKTIRCFVGVRNFNLILIH